jgi:hypothetical protein
MVGLAIYDAREQRVVPALASSYDSTWEMIVPSGQSIFDPTVFGW